MIRINPLPHLIRAAQFLFFGPHFLIRALVPLVSVRCHSRRVSKLRHLHYGASGDGRTPWSNIPNQNTSTQTLTDRQFCFPLQAPLALCRCLSAHFKLPGRGVTQKKPLNEKTIQGNNGREQLLHRISSTDIHTWQSDPPRRLAYED